MAVLSLIVVFIVRLRFETFSRNTGLLLSYQGHKALTNDYRFGTFLVSTRKFIIAYTKIRLVSTPK
jgi:hypothetical protein